MKRICLFLVIAVIAFCSCNNNSDEPSSRQVKQLELNQEEVQMLQHNNDFSINMLSLIGQNEQKSNICFSPLSASMALGILMNGADNETFNQIQKALGFDDATQDAINQYYHKLIEALPALDSQTTVNLANALWLHERYEFFELYKKTTREVFDATIDNVYSFTDQATLDMINKWAAEHTNNLIKEVITPDMVTPQTVMIFANALYFKGMWDKHFDKRLTHKANFYTADQRTVSVDMMSMSESLLYASADDAQMLELDYKEGKYCMDILLPNNDIPMSDFLAELTADKWQNYISALKEMSELQVYMPKFHFSYKRNLNNDLQQIGIINAFDKDNADFSKLSPLPTYLSFLYQYCYVAVDEESTEAAAVTIGGMEANSIPNNLFRADHPFIFVIREKQYGTILFTGIVGNPTEE